MTRSRGSVSSGPIVFTSKAGQKQWFLGLNIVNPEHNLGETEQSLCKNGKVRSTRTKNIRRGERQRETGLDGKNGEWRGLGKRSH